MGRAGEGGGWHEAMVAGGRYGVTHDKHVLAFIINSLGTLASRGCAAFLFALGAHGLANNDPADCAAGPAPDTDTGWLVNGTGKVPRLPASGRSKVSSGTFGANYLDQKFSWRLRHLSTEVPPPPPGPTHPPPLL